MAKTVNFKVTRITKEFGDDSKQEYLDLKVEPETEGISSSGNIRITFIETDSDYDTFSIGDIVPVSIVAPS